MSEHDVIIDRVELLGDDVEVLAAPSPAHELAIDVTCGEAVASASPWESVSASLHGGLDIAQAAQLGNGTWQLQVSAVLLEPDFRLSIRAQTDDGLIDLAAVVGRNGRFGVRSKGMQALLMHQLGRAGSTMMMRLLAGHPEIAVFDDYPLEARPGLAAMHGIGVLLGAQTVPLGDEPFFDADASVTANPYLTERFLGASILADNQRQGFDRVRTATAEMVEDAYDAVRPGAAFFAEKFRIESPRANLTQQTTLATWPRSRQIVLVRDPRDLLCSRLSFNQKRSEASFDLDLTDDAVTGVPTIVDHLRIAARQVQAFPEAILVRYEDLVLQPVATATRIFRELELDHGYATVVGAVENAVMARSEHHSTTDSPSASIGRWRTELPPAAADHIVAELASELPVLGYDR
ncbi:MAG: sulfotransferase [Ilumatobacter sp.]